MANLSSLLEGSAQAHPAQAIDVRLQREHLGQERLSGQHVRIGRPDALELADGGGAFDPVWEKRMLHALDVLMP